MTRKDYELIASAIRMIYQLEGESVIIREIVTALADKLEAGNPLFNRKRFVEACLRKV